ncbi:MAG: M16 family metallopeptidase [Desulfitobacteriia bacterium]|jgi:predicted Zn-dependent peptidase
MYRKHTLPNGVRIITEEIDHVRSVAIGIWVKTGSRNETKGYEGISHFIEHMFFKGTQKRSARELAETLEAVGGQLNAFTTKEFTCYYARVLDEHVPLAIDVLSDMFFNSRFDNKEIEKEKNVVLEEIKMYQDTPDELIHDLFSRYVWENNSLGKPILGEEETIKGFNEQKIRAYLESNYSQDRIVIAVAGKIKHEDIVKRLACFGEFQRPGTELSLEKPKGSTVRKSVIKDTEQLHLIVGVPGLGQDDEYMPTLQIINNILGGGLSSRLFQEIREQRGLAYSVYSYHSTYVDTGLFAVYAGTSLAKVEEVIKCIVEQLDCLKENGITEEELRKTKAQIKGSLYLGLESVSSRMSRLGKTELAFGKVKTVDETVEQIEKVSLANIKELLQQLWQRGKISILTLGKELKTDFDRLLQ